MTAKPAMKLKSVEEIFDDIMAVLDPATKRKVWPRRIATPDGYVDPKYFSLASVSHALKKDMFPVGGGDSAHLRTTVALSVFNRMGCPTYFVGKELLAAIDATEPPKDMTLSEIKFPLDSMLFVLPDAFSLSRLKWRLPYLMFSRIPKGDFDPDPWLANGHFHLEADFVILHYPMIRSDGDMVGYSWWSATDVPLAEYELKPADMIDDGEVIRSHLKWWNKDLDKYMVRPDLEPTKDEEVGFGVFMSSLLVKLLSVLNARPHYITEGDIARPQRIKRGVVVKEELWNPSFIGKDYKIRRDYVAQGGTHAPPRTHWRMGHWHTVRFGKQRVNSRRDWFEPVLVNA